MPLHHRRQLCVLVGIFPDIVQPNQHRPQLLIVITRSLLEKLWPFRVQRNRQNGKTNARGRDLGRLLHRYQLTVKQRQFSEIRSDILDQIDIFLAIASRLDRIARLILLPQRKHGDLQIALHEMQRRHNIGEAELQLGQNSNLRLEQRLNGKRVIRDIHEIVGFGSIDLVVFAGDPQCAAPDHLQFVALYRHQTQVCVQDINT
mmetsp:Transcript_39150/g.62523  ORF Transcript_39150/g.62523 Transcript_39150/m.62523 type:complete len:203 (-) Transcript_39150:1029-1637(-)